MATIEYSRVLKLYSYMLTEIRGYLSSIHVNTLVAIIIVCNANRMKIKRGIYNLSEIS